MTDHWNAEGCFEWLPLCKIRASSWTPSPVLPTTWRALTKVSSSYDAVAPQKRSLKAGSWQFSLLGLLGAKLESKIPLPSSGNPLKAKLSTSIIELQTALNTTVKAYTASHLPHYQYHPTWLTHLAVVQLLEVAALAIVDAATEVEATDEDGEAHAAAATSQKRKNGNQLPSSVVSSRRGRSRTWNRSTSTHYQSKNTRLSTSSCQN